MNAIDELASVPTQVKADEIQLARQVIGSFEGELDWGEFRDEYQAELRKIVDAKIAGEEIVMPAEETPAKVVNLMEALRKSLDSVGKTQKKPAKAQLGTRAPVRSITRKRKRA